MQDYVDRFLELVDQLNAYDSTTNILHYITRFVDGLYPDICAVLLVQRPDSLDTTYTLALLQEEAGDNPRRRELAVMAHFLHDGTSRRLPHSS